MKKIIAWVVGVPLISFIALMLFAWAHVTPEISMIVEAKDAVRDQLRDAGSADFRNIAVYKVDGAEVVCGEVNARNAFGAMAGYSRFFYRDGGTAIMEGIDTGPDMGGVWSAEGCDGSKGGAVAFG